MNKFRVTFLREFLMEIEADNLTMAQDDAHRLALSFPEGNAKVLSIYVDGYIASPDAPSPAPFTPRNIPPGGTPGTPIVREEELVDQVAA